MRYLTYDELIQLPTFEERFDYLKQNGSPSEVTFGGHRLLNQMLYKSPQWKETRNRVILRDQGCDLGIEDRPIQKEESKKREKKSVPKNNIMVHHLNPITIEQVANLDPCVFDMNNLICCSHATHNAIHYGDKENLPPTKLTERKPGDTKLW